MKHIIVLCSLHNQIEIENKMKTIDYRFFTNTATELKKLIRWVIKLKNLFQFTLTHEHLHFELNNDHSKDIFRYNRITSENKHQIDMRRKNFEMQSMKDERYGFFFEGFFYINTNR